MKYKKLRGYRMMANTSQLDLANMLGISLTAYSHKETGRIKFNAEQMKCIRDYLSEKLGQPLTIDELFF